MFYAKTKYANRLKALFELLFNNLKTVCFTIDKDGIHLKSTTTLNLMIEVELNADKFDEYKFDFDGPLHIGLESYISKSFKTMKNKNVVTLSITNPGLLVIGVKSTGKDNFEYDLEVVTESVQNVSFVALHSYSSASRTQIPASRFSDMCKLIKSISDFTVTKERGILKFACRTPDIYAENFKFGEEDPKDTNLVHHIQKSDQLFRMSKIVSFSRESSKVVDIYAEKDKPLMISSTSELGIIKTYFL